MDQRDIIIERACRRADDDVALGIANLERAASRADEWKHTTHQGARHPVAIPERAMLTGMLNHLRQAFARNHQ